MPPAGFEHLIPADEKLQTQAFGRVATGIGTSVLTVQVKRHTSKAVVCCIWMSNPIFAILYSFCGYVACKVNVTRLSWCIESFRQ